MAQEVKVILVDDVDGGPASETLTFAFDGVNYEIDLSERNAARLRADLEPWISAGRRVTPRRSSAASRGSSRRREDSRLGPRPRTGSAGPRPHPRGRARSVRSR